MGGNHWHAISEKEADEYLEIYRDLHNDMKPALLAKKMKNKKYQLSIGNLDLSYQLWEHMKYFHENDIITYDETVEDKPPELDIKPNPNFGRTVFNNTTYGLCGRGPASQAVAVKS